MGCKVVARTATEGDLVAGLRTPSGRRDTYAEERIGQEKGHDYVQRESQASNTRQSHLGRKLHWWWVRDFLGIRSSPVDGFS